MKALTLTLKMMLMLLMITLLVMSTGIAPVTASSNSTATVDAFQPAGSHGGGVLTPGDEFPPTGNDHAKLHRGNGKMKVNIHTSGLPAGAYTVWWIVFNNPGYCSGGAGNCGGGDLGNPDVDASVFWATGGIVQANGIGNFQASYTLGDSRGGAGQNLIEGGPIDLSTAEIHNVIKYHGPASSDKDVLYEQTHTVYGSCNEGANAIDFGPPRGVQCFDPQAVGFPLP